MLPFALDFAVIILLVLVLLYTVVVFAFLGYIYKSLIGNHHSGGKPIPDPIDGKILQAM